ncbi:MAG: SDR family oxidoreductase [Bacteroidales bacterium]|nr:SDR family oxidoreductase [Bacteroidales bacterium]
MHSALIVGGASGIGLAIAVLLASRETTNRVFVVDKNPFPEPYRHPKIESKVFDLRTEDYSFFDQFTIVDTLMITAGFGKLAHFHDLTEQYIIDSFQVNTLPVLRLVKRFYPRLESPEPFQCGVMVSIAGFLSSPLFSVYGSTKAALRSFIESVNVELTKAGSRNRILNVSPGFIKGTGFYQKATDISVTKDLALEIITHLEAHDDLFIPDYESVYQEVLERYHADFRKEGLHSYDYKLSRM